MRRFLIALVLLLLFLLPALLLTSHRINTIAEESALHTLFLTSQQVKRDILGHIDRFGERLDIIATLLIERGEPLDSPFVRQMLDWLSRRLSPVDRLFILLPDGRTVSSKGVTAASPEGRAAFEDELARAPFISHLEDDPDGGGKKVLRLGAPIVSTEPLGLLVAVINTNNIPRFLGIQNMDRNYQISLLEGESGDVVVDTWHKKIGNVSDFGMYTPQPGYDWQQMLRDTSQERAGSMIFFSQQARELFYLRYEPLGINTWSVMLSLPERVVLRDARDIKSLLFALQAFTFGVSALFLFWTLFDAIRENRRKSDQLNLVRQALRLEKQLAVAHREPAVMHDALKTVARILTATSCSFLLFRDGRKLRSYSSDPSREAYPIPDMPSLHRMLLEKGRVLLDAGSLRDRLPEEERQRLRQLGIYSILLCLVEDPKNNLLAGVLCAVNLEQRWGDIETLDLVVPSFVTTLANISTRIQLKEKSELDALTGLRNRTCFEADLADCAARPMRALTCAYMDANGLRELNNNHGHEVGDRMLRHVARALAETFGTETTYRIGGDEFAAVIPDLEEAEAQRKLEAFQRIVAEQGYACSAGLASSPWPTDIPALLKVAEKRMYADKRRYYQEPGRERREKRYDFPGE